MLELPITENGHRYTLPRDGAGSKSLDTWSTVTLP